MNIKSHVIFTNYLIEPLKYCLWLFLFLLSCVHKDKKEIPIKGDWAGIDNQTVNGLRSKAILFSFEDSMCSIMHPWDKFKKYFIKKDILHVTNHSAYHILKLTDDSLILKTTALQNVKNDTIRLKKIDQKNSIFPEKILFISSGCFGECPSMMLEIDSSANVHFFGKRHTDKLGGFTGIINKKIYQHLLQKIRNLPIDSLQKTYEANWTDDQTCGVTIIANGKNISSSAYGFSKEPVELRFLFHYLRELYKSLDIKADTKITEEYFSQNPGCKELFLIVMPPPVLLFEGKILPPKTK